MKLKINYDLLERIQFGNTGFALKKEMGITVAALPIQIINCIISLSKEYPISILLPIAIKSQFIAFGVFSLMFKNMKKSEAIKSLKELSCELKKININTNSELLLKAYQYKTDYEINYDKPNIPRLEQKKYIMVPTYIDGEEKEVSIVQEHTIGTKKYYLSHGSPQRAFKLATNPI